MLVLSRKVGQEIVIAGQIRVKIVALHGKRVRLAIEAPVSVPIHRSEIHQMCREYGPELSTATEMAPELTVVPGGIPEPA